MENSSLNEIPQASSSANYCARKPDQPEESNLYQYEDQVQFAATAGNSPAMIPRLYLDVLYYQMGRYLFLILGYVFLLIFSSELYKRLFGKAISEAEVTRLPNDTQLGKIYFYTWVGILVLIVIL